MPRLDDLGYPAGVDTLRHDADRIFRYSLFAIGNRHLAAFGLGNDLAGDHQDVAINQGRFRIVRRLGGNGASDYCNEIIALHNFGQTGNAPDRVSRHRHHHAPSYGAGGYRRSAARARNRGRISLA
jgi:hypothetical protein